MSQNDRATFVDGPHWRTEFVANSPYRVERWEQGVDMVLRAHDGFVLGKPKTDVIIMRFITDASTIVANLLAGTADVAFHSSIGFPELDTWNTLEFINSRAIGKPNSTEDLAGVWDR